MTGANSGDRDEFYQPVTKGEIVSLALAIRGTTIPMLEYMVADWKGERNELKKQAAIENYIEASKEFSKVLSQIASWMDVKEGDNGEQG